MEKKIFTEDELAAIEEYSALLFPIWEIAIVIDVEEKFLKREIKDSGSLAYRAYQKGRIMTKKKINQGLILVAEHGSPQAISQVIGLLEDTII